MSKLRSQHFPSQVSTISFTTHFLYKMSKLRSLHFPTLSLHFSYTKCQNCVHYTSLYKHVKIADITNFLIKCPLHQSLHFPIQTSQNCGHVHYITHYTFPIQNVKIAVLVERPPLHFSYAKSQNCVPSQMSTTTLFLFKISKVRS